MVLDDHWQRITRWLGANAPATAAAIRPPAQDSAIAAAQEVTGRPWPEELVEFYRLADGADRTPAGYVLPGQRPLPVAELVQSRQVYQQSWASIRRSQAIDADRRARESLLARMSGMPPPLDPYDVDRLDGDPAGSEAGMFLPSFLPIAEDQSGSCIVVDARPGPLRGCVTNYMKENTDIDGRLWPSVGSMLADVAAALETGAPAGLWIPEIEEGRLSWFV